MPPLTSCTGRPRGSSRRLSRLVRESWARFDTTPPFLRHPALGKRVRFAACYLFYTSYKWQASGADGSLARLRRFRLRLLAVLTQRSSKPHFSPTLPSPSLKLHSPALSTPTKTLQRSSTLQVPYFVAFRWPPYVFFESFRRVRLWCLDLENAFLRQLITPS